MGAYCDDGGVMGIYITVHSVIGHVFGDGVYPIPTEDLAMLKNISLRV